MKTEPWYAVRCLFSHPSRVDENTGESSLYEERITLWTDCSETEAFKLAEEEAVFYAKENDCIFVEVVNCYHLFEEFIGNGSEIWSHMRGSNLTPDLYIQTFCCTSKDRVRFFNDEAK